MRFPALAALLLLPLAAGCATFSRLGEVGSPPALSAGGDPTLDPRWRPVTMPTPVPELTPASADSLWRPGSRAFFKDQRAAQVGDLVTVVVSTTDSAIVNNATTATRSGSEALGAPDVFGLQNPVGRTLGRNVDLSRLLSTTSASSAVGSGKIARGESVQLRIGGVVTQVLPNGNLAVIGRQEIRVNSELRELLLSGIIRREDIQSDNTVLHDRMAEARISYGGRGQVTDVQTPHWGQQIFDIISPF